MEHLIKNAEHYANINILKGLTDIIKVADKLDDAVLKLCHQNYTRIWCSMAS